MTDPNTHIHLLIELPVLGALGERTDTQRTKACDDCGRLDVQHHQIEVAFDRWRGEGMFQVGGLTFVTGQLKAAFDENDITGLAYQKALASKGDGFKFGAAVKDKTLPEVYLLEVTGRASGPDHWNNHVSDCATCGDAKWWPNMDGIRSRNGPALTGTGQDVEDPLPRRVDSAAWQGDDAFLLQDPGPIVVTDKLRQIVLTSGTQKAFFRPTEWA